MARWEEIGCMFWQSFHVPQPPGGSLLTRHGYWLSDVQGPKHFDVDYDDYDIQGPKHFDDFDVDYYSGPTVSSAVTLWYCGLPLSLSTNQRKMPPKNEWIACLPSGMFGHAVTGAHHRRSGLCNPSDFTMKSHQVVMSRTYYCDCTWLHTLWIWWFPEIGLPPVIINFHWIFRNKNHPAFLGYHGLPPWLWNPPDVPPSRPSSIRRCCSRPFRRSAAVSCSQGPRALAVPQLEGSQQRRVMARWGGPKMRIPLNHPIWWAFPFYFGYPHFWKPPDGKNQAHLRCLWSP